RAPRRHHRRRQRRREGPRQRADGSAADPARRRRLSGGRPGYRGPAPMPPRCGPRRPVTPSFTAGLALTLSSAFRRLSLSPADVGASTFLDASVTWALVRGALKSPPRTGRNYSDTFVFTDP